jgi:hypothetical protein
MSCENNWETSMDPPGGGGGGVTGTTGREEGRGAALEGVAATPGREEGRGGAGAPVCTLGVVHGAAELSATKSARIARHTIDLRGIPVILYRSLLSFKSKEPKGEFGDPKEEGNDTERNWRKENSAREEDGRGY